MTPSVPPSRDEEATTMTNGLPVMTAILGYVLYCEKYDVVYRSHIYENEPDAKKALEAVVWHNRHQYAVLPITMLNWSAP